MQEIEAAIELSRLPGIGAKKFRELIEKYNLPSLALKQVKSKNEIIKLFKCSKTKSSTSEQASNTLEYIKKHKYFAYYYNSVNYPKQFNDLSEPPPLIFSTAPIPASLGFAAIVGARELLDESCEEINKIVRFFARQNFAIVSGGARGADAQAHRAAIEANVFTVAVLGNGIDVMYPKNNKTLFDDIKKRGALLTELMCGALPQKSFFPTRNRLIAALADVVVIVQAKQNSGSMITAKWARKLGRKLFTIEPLTNSNEKWSGNLQLISQKVEVLNYNDT